MKILILGGDGFCGWPTTLHLSELGHDVAIVDGQPEVLSTFDYVDEALAKMLSA